MKDNSKLTAIILVVVTIIVVVVSLIIEKNGQESDERDILIVTNASNFYTVNSCLYRVMTYVSAQDIESLMLLLNENYKNENKITKDNVLDLFSDVDSNSTFVSEKMYYETLSSNLVKYYVKGYIEENQIYDDEVLKKEDRNSVYFIVYLDSSDKIFSIEPYDGEIFKEGDINEG